VEGIVNIYTKRKNLSYSLRDRNDISSAIKKLTDVVFCAVSLVLVLILAGVNIFSQLIPIAGTFCPHHTTPQPTPQHTPHTTPHNTHHIPHHTTPHRTTPHHSLRVLSSGAFFALSFMFGPAAKSFMDSFILIYVSHPFDVGDKISLDGKNLSLSLSLSFSHLTNK